MKSSVSVTNYLLFLPICLFAIEGVTAFPVVRHQRFASRNMHPSTTGSPFTTIAPHHGAPLNMIGGLFGGTGNSGHSKLALDEAVTVYSSTLGGDTNVEFEGLSEYITKWATNMFANGGIKLTTPVVVEPVSSENARGIRLLFKNTNTGYKNKSEESESDKTRPKEASNDAQKKKKGTMQGGVEILVEKTGVSEVKVLARRCEIDEDTVIKEMSEETIMSELHQAIAVWKRAK